MFNGLTLFCSFLTFFFRETIICSGKQRRWANRTKDSSIISMTITRSSSGNWVSSLFYFFRFFPELPESKAFSFFPRSTFIQQKEFRVRSFTQSLNYCFQMGTYHVRVFHSKTKVFFHHVVQTLSSCTMFAFAFCQPT